jgi:hypothetical protein
VRARQTVLFFEQGMGEELKESWEKLNNKKINILYFYYPYNVH